MKKNFLVADFAGTREEAVAWCEAHPQFHVVSIPDAEFPGVAQFVGDGDEVPDSVVLEALNLFNQLGWENAAVARLELDDKDLVG